VPVAPLEVDAVFRLLLLLLLLGTAFVLIEPSWAPDTRTLSLRLRESGEFQQAVSRAARALGDKAAERVAGAISDAPPVSAPPPERAAENHSEEERSQLDRLVEEKTRAP
jgi:hypothetical protein